MYLRDPRNYDCWVAYFSGLDAGSSGTALLGFQEFVASHTRLPSFTWAGGIVRIAFPRSKSGGEIECRSDPDRAITTLLDLLEAYCAERERGLSDTSVAYEKCCGGLPSWRAVIEALEQGVGVRQVRGDVDERSDADI